jgi:hypothetical protein
MKQTIISLAVFAGMFFVGPVPNAQARQCSNASLQGAYGFHGIATIVPAGTPRAIIGVFTFDGKGHWSATLTINDNGTVTHLPPAAPGTYTVKADCTGTLLPDSGPFGGPGGSVEIVVVDSGKEFYQMRTDPSTVVLYGVTKKLFPDDNE